MYVTTRLVFSRTLPKQVRGLKKAFGAVLCSSFKVKLLFSPDTAAAAVIYSSQPLLFPGLPLPAVADRTLSGSSIQRAAKNDSDIRLPLPVPAEWQGFPCSAKPPF